MTDDWEARVAAVWATASTLDDQAVLRSIDALVAERPDTDAAAVFESASARDYLVLEAEAEPLYRRAIELGLDDRRLPQSVIQLASTLRNLGRPGEAVALLEDWLLLHPSDDWSGPASAFLALALASAGDDRKAASVALTAIAGYLPAYSNAVRRYAADLLD
ncbi:MAG: tetratricopeptide repeat protein [Aeromicrobium sp.]